ncbi:CPBP family intramembrane metalloprotease [Actinoplanes oblitus]|uniref:CPBP family intramembrane metalloprotease n=1 Tax=Actinoplanes oblitus TaxID=3040509 RepID=A0ABY8WTJ1_9ACTN|nr:CPBP family intramembrane glutamic endopeptidase [Actinoplanes oblitus]WIN00459.1 CPBP family intramembrane metalloprotease [Actinoplanes oblitus]
MFATLSDRTASIVFVLLVLGASLGTATIADGLILAFSPLLVVLLMLLVVTREGYARDGWRRLGLGRLGLRYWPVAIATTAGVCLLATVGVVAFGFARFAAPRGPWLADVLALCVAGPILAFAEEIGWRGYLQPRLSFLGERAAMLTVGVVWIGWHLPYILFTPNYHSGGNRAVVLTLFGGSVLAFSFLIGYLRTVSASVWPAVLAHFAHNATFAALTIPIATEQPVVVDEYLSGDSGLFVLLGTAACAVAVGVSRARANRLPVPASGRG